jgi:hypothetical protein
MGERMNLQNGEIHGKHVRKGGMRTMHKARMGR